MNGTSKKKIQEKDTEAKKLIADIRPLLNDVKPAVASEAVDHIDQYMTEQEKTLAEANAKAKKNSSNGHLKSTTQDNSVSP